jgi:NAD(P)-dependent dehydrogenase (short-subunit alcohol dehydrogenase family)
MFLHHKGKISCLNRLERLQEELTIKKYALVTGGTGGIGAAIYAASKGAVEVFTRALAKELAEYNIRVNAVSPGTIDTAFHSATSKEVMESWKAGIPMKRFGQPKEVAAVIEFLASDKASYLTGEVIQINGGQAFI